MTIDSMDIKTTITAFIRKRVGDNVEFSHDDDIFELGLVNSMFALELVNFLESEFSVTVENEDIDLANFNKVSAMEQFISRKKNA